MQEEQSHGSGQQKNLKILNLSNVNAKGQHVLNDEKLLELLRIYPFLYDPFIKPFRDPDYDEWAWKNITSAFNKTYDGFKMGKPFSVLDLQKRWDFLQPIVIGLSEISDSIPFKLKRHVLRMSGPLQYQSINVPHCSLSNAQRLIIDNIDMVEKLPLHQRQQLEAEIMRLILKNEIEQEDKPKPKGRLNSHMLEPFVDEECEEFFDAIGINDIIELENNLMQNNEEEKMTPLHSLNQNLNTLNGTEITIVNLLNKDSQIKNFKGFPSPASPAKTSILPNEPLLIQLDRPRWIKLDRVHFYTRKCRVKLKRIR